MSKSLFFLVPLLPDLAFDKVLPMEVSQLQEMIDEHLPSGFRADLAFVLSWFDLQNLPRVWKERPLLSYGNFKQVEELLDAFEGVSATKEKQLFSDSMRYYFIQYPETHQRLNHFPELSNLFFEMAVQHDNPFISQYFKLERHLRLVFTGLRAKKLRRNIINELEYEDHTDPLVVNLIAQRDSPHYAPPSEDAELCHLIEQDNSNPLEMMKRFEAYRFKKIEELCGKKHFSLDRVLATLLELILLEKYHAHDQEEGTSAIEKILRTPL